jgi:hypothetical protein
MSTTEKKLAQAMEDLLMFTAENDAGQGDPDRDDPRVTAAMEALATHEADKQRESEDERRTFERAYEQICLGPWAGTMEMAWQVWQAGRASAQAVPAWQPIETAPRDGTHILVWTECSDTAYVVCWADFDKNIRPYLCAKQRTVGWHLAWDGEHFGGMWAPTHWMPLPAAPKGD